MAYKWIERERKLTVRAKRKKQDGKFRDKENRNKITGKQRKIYNEVRRLRDFDNTYNDLGGNDNGI